MHRVSQINAVWGIIILLMLIQTTVVWALYFDFEDDAQLDQWDVQGDWKIEKDDLTGSGVLSGEGADEITALVGEHN